MLQGGSLPDRGRHLEQSGRRTTALDFIKYEFDEVYVDSVQWSGSSGGDDTPSESVSFSFGKVSITYTPQNKDGSKGSPAVGAWDLTAVST